MPLPLSLVDLHRDQRSFGAFLHGTLHRDDDETQQQQQKKKKEEEDTTTTTDDSASISTSSSPTGRSNKKLRRSARIKTNNNGGNNGKKKKKKKNSSPVSALRQQQGLLSKIWSFVKTDENAKCYYTKVMYQYDCFGDTEGVWGEILEGGGTIALTNMLIINRCLISSMKEDDDDGTDWDSEMSDEEFRRRFHEYVDRDCRCGKCGGLPGDTLHDDGYDGRVEAMAVATEEELRERGYRGKDAVPKRFWGGPE